MVSVNKNVAWECMNVAILFHAMSSLAVLDYNPYSILEPVSAQSHRLLILLESYEAPVPTSQGVWSVPSGYMPHTTPTQAQRGIAEADLCQAGVLSGGDWHQNEKEWSRNSTDSFPSWQWYPGGGDYLLG